MTSSLPRSTAILSDDELSALVEATPASGLRRSIVLLAAVAIFGSLFFGYDIGVVAGILSYTYIPSVVDGLGLNEFDEGLIGATLTLGVALDAILGGGISDSRGRCFNILPPIGVFTTVTLGCILSPNIPVLLFFRFIFGWVVGGASVTVPIYLPESASTRARGQPAALGQFMIAFGQLLAYPTNAMLARGHGGPYVTVDLIIAQSSQLS